VYLLFLDGQGTSAYTQHGLGAGGTVGRVQKSQRGVSRGLKANHVLQWKKDGFWLIDLFRSVEGIL
jgi:hypothetical protein